MRLITLSAFLFIAATRTAFALPFDDGIKAYKDGNWARAVEVLKPIAEDDNANSAEAQLRLGLLAERGLGMPKDTAVAVKWIKRAADAGNATAQAHLGRLYRLGAGVPKDGAQAARYSIKGASQGNAVAETNLGYMALEGMGGPLDPVAATGWFKRAADQGDPSAMMALGTAYEQGRGAAKDPVQARKWYLLVVATGSGDYEADLPDRAKKANEALAAKMTPAQIEQADKLATEFKPAPKR
jgi:TPR repeat protein